MINEGDTIQGGQGATSERTRRGKLETIETIKAGEIAQRDAWHDIIAFAIDEGMLAAEYEDGWLDYCRLRSSVRGSDRSGTGGDGLRYSEWILFSQFVGPANFRWLNELWDYPVPCSQIPEEVKFTRWRLNRCMDKIRSALTASSDAAQKASRAIDDIRNHKK